MLDQPEHVEQLRDVMELLDDAILLGSTLHEKQSSLGISGDDYIAMQSIMKRAASLDATEVVYSGRGFVPVVDPEGELVTVYKEVDGARGQLGRVYVSDAADMLYVSPKNIVVGDDDEDDVDDDSSVGTISEARLEMQEFKNSLAEAPEGLRLFVEFIMHKEIGVDKAIRGHAVRTSTYTMYNIMDAAHLQILDVSKQKEDPEKIFQDHEIDRALKAFDDHYKENIRTKKFRRRSAKSQSAIVDTFLEGSNEMLKLDRFIVHSEVDCLYAPDSTEPEGFRTIQPYIHFQGKCLRYDSVETKLLSEGIPLRRRPGDEYEIDGTCVVVEIDDAVRDFIGLPTNIVWLPVKSQLSKMNFVERELGL